ncbi:MAG: hypothetical protein ACRDJH_12865 [Thermomicrobiales bacterium]
MSLTSHLKNPSSPVHAFFQDRFPNTREVVRECRARLAGVETILPPVSTEQYPYSLIGMAFDYRLRFYFAETPLTELVAYHGMINVEAVGYRLLPHSADELKEMLERGDRVFSLGDFLLQRVPLAEVRAEEVLAEVPPPLRDVKVGRGFIQYDPSVLDDLYVNDADVDALRSVCGKVMFLGDTSVASPNVDEFADRLGRTLAELSPIGRRLPRPQEEMLARYCVVLALYETIYRSGQVPESLRLPSTASMLTTAAVDDLLAIPQQNWIDDLCNLSWAFHDDNGDLLRGTAILNPMFDGSGHVGGADADIIIDGCLIEFKVTIDKGLKKLRDWLY